MQWEYKTLGYPAWRDQDFFIEDGQQVNRKGDKQAGLHRAQELGQEGWEVIAVDNGLWVMKRAKQ